MKLCCAKRDKKCKHLDQSTHGSYCTHKDCFVMVARRKLGKIVAPEWCPKRKLIYSFVVKK